MKVASNKIRTAKKSNIVCISAYKKRNVVKSYTKTHDDWLEITRANDPEKTLPDIAARLTGKIAYELHKNNDRPVFLSTHWFEKVTKKKRHQNSRLRKQISHIYHFKRHPRTFQDGKMLYNVFEICYTSDAFKIMNLEDVKIEQSIASKPQENKLQAWSKNAPTMEQKCSIYIDNKVIERDLEEISLSITNNEKLKIKKSQETENTTCSNAILTEHSQVAIPEPKEIVTACDDTKKPKLLTASEEKAIHLERVQRTHEDTGMSNFAQLMSKVLNQSEPIAQEEIPAMKQEEQNPIPDKETRKMLLSKAIFDAFGATANEIQDNCSFEEISPLKVCIKPTIGVSFNDIEKAKIRKCIKSVYGEEVILTLVNTNLYVNKEPVATESVLAKSEVLLSNSCNNPQWLRFKAELTKVLLKKHEEKIALHILKNWFDKLRVSDNSTSQKLILVGSVFTIQWIDDKFGMELENAVLASNLTIELRDEANRNRPLIFSKETIKRG